MRKPKPQEADAGRLAIVDAPETDDPFSESPVADEPPNPIRFVKLVEVKPAGRTGSKGSVSYDFPPRRPNKTKPRVGRSSASDTVTMPTPEPQPPAPAAPSAARRKNRSPARHSANATTARQPEPRLTAPATPAHPPQGNCPPIVPHQGAGPAIAPSPTCQPPAPAVPDPVGQNASARPGVKTPTLDPNLDRINRKAAASLLSAELDDGDRLRREAGILANTAFPAASLQGLGLGDTISIPGARLHLAEIRQAAGGPTDPAERMALDTMNYVYLRIPRAFAKADEARGSEAPRILHSSAIQLVGAFAKVGTMLVAVRESNRRGGQPATGDKNPPLGTTNDATESTAGGRGACQPSPSRPADVGRAEKTAPGRSRKQALEALDRPKNSRGKKASGGQR